MRTLKGVVAILIVVFAGTSSTAQIPGLLAKAQAASVTICNLKNEAVDATAFVTQASSGVLVVVSVDHFYRKADTADAVWVVTRPDWEGILVEVSPASRPRKFASSDLRVFYSTNLPLPSQCRITPLRQFNTARKGEQVYMVGNFFEGQFDRLLSGHYVGFWHGEAHCTPMAGNSPGTSGSPVLNSRGHVVGIMTGHDSYRDGREYDTFEPIETLERYEDWIRAEAR